MTELLAVVGAWRIGSWLLGQTIGRVLTRRQLTVTPTVSTRWTRAFSVTATYSGEIVGTVERVAFRGWIALDSGGSIVGVFDAKRLAAAHLLVLAAARECYPRLPTPEVVVPETA
jgi:hypothetical protein